MKRDPFRMHARERQKQKEGGKSALSFRRQDHAAWRIRARTTIDESSMLIALNFRTGNIERARSRASKLPLPPSPPREILFIIIFRYYRDSRNSR